MKRYKQKFLKMVEHTNGTWIKIEDHDEDYINRWNAKNREYEIFNKSIYTYSLQANKYKLIIFTLSVLLIISMVF